MSTSTKCRSKSPTSCTSPRCPENKHRAANVKGSIATSPTSRINSAWDRIAPKTLPENALERKRELDPALNYERNIFSNLKDAEDAVKNYGPKSEKGIIAAKIAKGERERLKETGIRYPTFAYYRTVVQNEDKLDAVKEVAQRNRNRNPKYSWENVMGDARNTSQNHEAYVAKTEVLVLKDPQVRGQLKESAEHIRDTKMFVRAYDDKQASIPIAYDDAFNKSWTGTGYGSRKSVTENLARNKANIEGLEAGTIKPSKIINTGYLRPKEEAHRYLQEQKKELEEALRTKGRSYLPVVETVLAVSKQQQWLYAKGTMVKSF
jgi:hypothetical protein